MSPTVAPPRPVISLTGLGMMPQYPIKHDEGALPLRVLDLFSGIGGFSLGLERAGMKTIAFCEIEPFCQAVLRKHWPNVPIHDDVTKLRGDDVGPVDLICGGFPCQDISVAGKGAGINGTRSGLWSEFARLVGELRPRYVIVENVAALLGRGLGRVLGDLAALGYDAEWNCIPIASIGAPHERDRVWVIAHDRRERKQRRWQIEIQKQPAFSWCQDVGRASDLPDRSDLYESQLCRSRYGISERLDALGNSVSPGIVEQIGRAIMLDGSHG